MNIGETKHGLTITLEREVTYSNTLQRLERFYSIVFDDAGELCKPNACVLNPEKDGQRFFPYDDVWLLLYPQRFRLHVIRHWRYLSGPHAVRLYYQSAQTRQFFWIATLQIGEAMFYNEQTIRQELSDALAKREFYISPLSRNDQVPT